MPIYEYRVKEGKGCDYCKQPFEVMQGFKDEPLKECPECGSELEKILSKSTFVLKGGGWYKDGYDKKND